jgi:mono/diheme cytochrome c family protein
VTAAPSVGAKLRTGLAAALLVLACASNAAASSAARPLAQVHYMLHCQGCHLPDGAGSPGRVPDLRGSVARYLTVEGGREYLVRVPGVSQAPLDDAALAAVLNWVLERFGPRDDARASPPFTAAEVARVRRPAWTDVTVARDALRRGRDGAAAPLVSATQPRSAGR